MKRFVMILALVAGGLLAARAMWPRADERIRSPFRRRDLVAELARASIEWPPGARAQARDGDRAYRTAESRRFVRQVGLPPRSSATVLVPSLLAPPGSRYRFELGSATRFRSRFGLDGAEGAAPDTAFRFRVSATNRGRDEVLFTRVVSAGEQRAHGGWFELDVPLPKWVGPDATLELAVDVDTTPVSPAPAPVPVWGAPALFEPDDRRPRRPTVILVSIDTLRADATGPYGARGATPHIAALTADGVTFENAFSTSPWTTPSQLSLLTGLYPSGHGLNRAYGRNLSLAEPGLATLADRLSAAGYTTVAVASDHAVDPELGFDKGFHAFHNHVTQDMADLMPAVRGALDRLTGEPLFLFLHTYDPHAPLFRTAAGAPTRVGRLSVGFHYHTFIDLGPPTEAEVAFVRTLYADHVRYVDARIGELVALLKERGLYDEALIVLTSDHGEELFDRGHYGHGFELYEHQLHVPLIVKFPRGERFRARVDALTSLVDVVPSLLEYLGLEPGNVDGTSFLDVLRGRAEAHRDVAFAEALAWGPERKALRTKRFKYIRTFADAEVRALGLRNGTYDKLLDKTPGEELYFLEDDPGERIDVAALHPDLVARMRALLAAFCERETPQGAPRTRDPAWVAAMEALGYFGGD
ncbi:MAG: hypothetical protein E2O39_05525 [Planctomycetota bacterium]|nr:MAG: hypothetical protein E2O39_05525 [Planctomycetota bacterium]